MSRRAEVTDLQIVHAEKRGGTVYYTIQVDSAQAAIKVACHRCPIGPSSTDDCGAQVQKRFSEFDKLKDTIVKFCATAPHSTSETLTADFPRQPPIRCVLCRVL